MAKKKGDKRLEVTMTCSECEISGRAYYHTSRNRINTPNKLELRKYCKYCRKVTLFKENK